jgi:hypothetical protein
MLTGYLLFLLATQSGFTAGERTPAGARSLAMGGTSVTANDLWSLVNNQAGAAWLRGAGAGLSFENRFLVRELMYEQFGVALPLKPGTFGLTMIRFGNEQYGELKAGLSFSRKFGKQFSIGVQFDYLYIHVMNDYGNKHLISCETGLMYQADEHLSIGVHLLNPVPVKITEHPAEQLPSIICIGLSYYFSSDFLTNIEVEKDLEHPLTFRGGAEYHFARPAYARIGIATTPISFTFGVGLEFNKLKFDIASGYHQALGFSPTGSVIYSFK